VKPKVDHELRVGTSAHYDDPAYYAQAYEDRLDDIACYVSIAKKYGGPVLEYGCGAGRITIPIAREGIEIVGVDQSKPMLDDLRDRLRREPSYVRRRLKMRRGDMRSLQLGRRFSLVLATFNTVLHLYERADLERFFARVHEHLATGGRFVFDASVPSPMDLARDPSRSYAITPFVHARLGVRSRYAERFDYDPIRQILFVSMEFQPDRGEPFMTPLAHRQFFPAELEALLHYNGFEVEHREGGFKGEPVAPGADSIVWTCRRNMNKRAGSRAKRAGGA